MPGRGSRMQMVVPSALAALAGIAAVVAVALLIGVATVRWAHHISGLAEIAAIVVVGLLILAIALRRVLGGVRRGTILELDLQEPLQEVAPTNPLMRFSLGTGRQTLREVVETLERASGDARIAALFARVGPAAAGLGQIQELRDAIVAFRARGKRAVVFSESFGEFSPGNGAYYLATAFDEIALQPSGDVNLTGLMASVTFVRGALEKLGVVARLDHRQEYKTAMNLATETQFTPAHRESLDRVVQSQFEQIVRGISEARHVSETEVVGLIDRGPFLGPEAHEAGLVDRLAYRDQVISALKALAGPDARLLYLSHYAKRTRAGRRRGDTIAVIMGVGGIRRGKSGGFNPLDGGRPFMGSDSLAAAFRAAVKDKRVKAILFRVDSPGGSYVASDTIWRETVRAREAGKPVIVSMGNLAGSGGYFVAMAADKIVAQPGTITGSIGVVAGKAVTAGLRARLGLSTDELHTSSQATMWTDALDYSPGAWDKVQAFLDRAYQDFTGKVAAGRGLALETVQEVAKGRIWTGEDAKQRGLVDELGGYATAFQLARRAIGQPVDAPVRVKLYPRPTSVRDRLQTDRAESSEDAAAISAFSLAGVVPFAGRLPAALGLGETAVLDMGPVDIRL